MSLIDTFSISASGLTAQRIRLQAISSNMANVQTTRTPEGGPYRRRVPVFETQSNSFGDMLEKNLARVQVTDIIEPTGAGNRVFDPDHPDSDQDGYVDFPNVNILEEMVDMMNTSRTYEANTNVVDSTKQMATKALELGRL